MNQPNSKRKISPDNNVPGSEDPLKKKNKFNIYWIYGILFLSIIAYNMYRGVNSTGLETDQQKFYEMLKQGDVEKIKTIRNKKLVRIFYACLFNFKINFAYRDIVMMDDRD